MKKHRWHLLALLLALLLAAVAAGCGGDDEDEGEGAATTEEPAAEDVSGSISMLALWSGQEARSIRAVIAGFNERYPDVRVNYRSVPDVRPVLSTAIEGGNPPDVAALPNPGLMRDFVQRDALQSIAFARETIAENYGQSWLDLASVDGTLYGVFFKGANKSTVWYNVHAFEDAGLSDNLPETWEDFLAAAQTLNESGVPAYAIGAADGWVLTDLFENIYLRTAGEEMYDQLTNHEIPWTHASVKTALREMAKVIGDTENIAGGRSRSLQLDFEGSVAQVFRSPPQAGMVIEGDFVPGVGTEATGAKPQTDFNFFDFPSINDSPPVVMGGGDLVVMFDDNPAARAFIEYLATPEAAEIWVRRGGFSSPNKSVDENAYPDPILRESATALAQAETFRFDLSDLTPSAFGGDAMFTVLQDFMQNPDNIDGIAQRLEAEAKKAYAGQ
jgi:ABC-type glycerol-3-phosphate transport system substrate-binding protein